MRKALTLAAALVWTACSAALIGATAQPASMPKFGPDVVPMVAAQDYLRQHDVPDFWALMPFYVPQATESSCSVASAAMILNALRGVPALASDALITEATLLDANPDWAQATAPDGEGVSFAEFETYLRRSLAAYGLGQAQVEAFRPKAATPEALARLRQILSENEASSQDLIVAVFNQGVLTGDTDVGHISPLAAYDRDSGRVLVMDVDRKWYVPYWVSDEKLLEALVHRSAEDPERGGLVRVKRQDPTLALALN